MQYDNSRDAAVQLRLGSLFDLVENWRRSQAKIHRGPKRSESWCDGLLKPTSNTPRRDPRSPHTVKKLPGNSG
jgi:hypothetical protein